MYPLNVFIHKLLLITFCITYLFQSLNGQITLCTSLKASHLAYNEIGGIEFSNGLEYSSRKNSFILNGHMTYAVGNRDFEKENGELYTLVDGANRQDYPLPGIVPGLEESAYIKTLKLNTAKTMDVGFAISYGRVISSSEKNKLRMDLGINLSWVEESSIKYSYKGDLTNILGTAQNVYLVVPYTQNFFDLGPILSAKYDFSSHNKSSFGITADIVWLTQSGFKFSFGPFFRAQLSN